MPQTVLTYLQDILAEKMPLLTKEGVTQTQLDNLTTPCIVKCIKSVKVGGCTDYGIEVLPTGADKCVCQTVYLSDGRKYVRHHNGSKWLDGSWKLEGQNLNLECKIVLGTVYIRHGQLPEGCKIIMLRKKRRSRWRSTGGERAYAKNRGKRIGRSPKRQYVHYKGVVLNTSTANSWYVPKCVAVANAQADGNMLNKELGGLCRPFAVIRAYTADGNPVYKMTGVRNMVEQRKSTHTQNTAYTQIGLQVVSYNANGTVAVGGNILKLKYHLRRHKYKMATMVKDGKEYPVYAYDYYRSFSIE